MDNSQLSEVPAPELPPPSVRDSGWWLTALGTGLAILAIVFAPSLASWPLWLRLVSAPAVVALLYLMFGSWKFLKKFIFQYELGGQYAKLYSIAHEFGQRYAASERLLLLLSQSSSVFQPSSIYIFNQKITLDFEKKPGKTLELNRTVALFDLEFGQVFATFRVIKVGNKSYQAVSEQVVSPVFEGFVRSGGSSNPPPNSVLMLVPIEEESANV